MSLFRLPTLGFAACALVLVAVPACKKKPLEEVKKEILPKLKITEAPLPKDAIAEIVVKDPETFVKRLADGAGFGAEVGESPYKKLLENVNDEKALAGLRSVDPHGALAFVVLGTIAPGSRFERHYVGAAHLKDAAIVSAALEASVKGGGDNVKSTKSATLDVNVYEPGPDSALAVYGDLVLVADSRAALESAGKYVAWRSTSGKLDHDVAVRVPMGTVGPALRDVGNYEYAKIKPGDVPPSVKAQLDPVVANLLQGLADAGDFTLDADAKTDVLESESKLVAKGTFSKWLEKYPTSNANALLTLPKAEAASLYRTPEGLGALAYVLTEWGLSTTKVLTPADRAEALKALQALGKSVGHELTYASVTPKAAAGSPVNGVNTEMLFRIDLEDPAAAKASIPTLRKLVEKEVGAKTKLVVTPYKKHGAEGEAFSTPSTLPGMGGAGSTPTKDGWAWAVKGNMLYVDACLGCTPSLLDVALDPASKATLGDDPDAKKKIESFPGKGIVSASYTTKFTMPGVLGGMTAMLGGSSSKATTPWWGWSTASADGMVGKGAVPLTLLGNVARMLMMVGMGGAGMGGGGMGMGGPPPPF